MESKNKFKITLPNVFYTALLTAVVIICVGGVSLFPYVLRFPLIIATAVLSAGYIIFKQQKIYLNMPAVLILITVAYLLISVTYSIDSGKTLELATVYLCCSVIMLADFKMDFYKKAITAIKVVCIVFAFSIIISSFIDDCMLKYFSFIVNPTNNPNVARLLREEVRWSHSYSGFAREKGEAAFIMNVGIAVYYAKYFTEKKFTIKDLAFLLILFWGLILTSKRMLFLCPIMTAAALLLLSNKKGRFTKIIPIAFIIICCTITLASILPQFSHLFERFIDKESMTSLTGRVDLWPYSFEMFAKSPMIGLGIGSFNKYLDLHGVLIGGTKWTYYGHNIYYEFLGELGIIGCTLLFGALLMIIVKTVSLMRDKRVSSLEKYLLTFSFAIQITCFIYCASGNVLLYMQQIFIWFFAGAITLTLSRKYRKIKSKELSHA